MSSPRAQCKEHPNLPHIISSVIISSGVGSPLILGIHSNLWWVLASKSLWVQNKFNGFLFILLSLSFLQLFQIIILSSGSFLQVVSFCLKFYNLVPEFLSLRFQIFMIHSIQLQRSYSDTE